MNYWKAWLKDLSADASDLSNWKNFELNKIRFLIQLQIIFLMLNDPVFVFSLLFLIVVQSLIGDFSVLFRILANISCNMR